MSIGKKKIYLKDAFFNIFENIFGVKTKKSLSLYKKRRRGNNFLEIFKKVLTNGRKYVRMNPD
jgi:hypothetical protein